MKISSKSILSPGRAGVRTLSTSHSRRLRNSGSIRGGASPAMFSAAAKKRGSFENPEPSSPKVTCIGQVRVRSKRKQAKKLRSLSRRRSAGEVSFRKSEHPLNRFPSKRHKRNSSHLRSKVTQNGLQNHEYSPAQRKWVYFPVTICDSLKAFGSEFSCLFPCRTEKGKEEKTMAAEDGNRQGSCGEEFARWLVEGQDGEGGGERDIELIVGDGEKEEEEEESVRKSRRHVFEDLQIVDDRIEGHKDEGRESICIPPKNALLLMRRRSEPMKKVLTNRSWEPSVPRTDEEDELVDNEDEIEKDMEKSTENLEVEQKHVMILDQDQETVQDEANQEQENVHNSVQQDEANQVQEHNSVHQDEANQDQEHDSVQQDEANLDQEHNSVQQDEADQDQEHNSVQQDEANLDQERDSVQQDAANLDQEHDNMKEDEANLDQEHDNMQQDETKQDQEYDNVQQDEVGQDQELVNVQQDEANQDQEYDNVQQDEVDEDQEHDNVKQYEEVQGQEHNQTEEESFYLLSLFEDTENQDYYIQEQEEAHEEDDVVEIEAEKSTMMTEFAEIHEEETVNEAEEHNNGVLERESEVKEGRENENVLPECLLMMMMYEPKLSTEVSKETWVCRTDFIQRQSSRRKPPASAKSDGGAESSIIANAAVNDVARAADGGFQMVLQPPAPLSCTLPAAPSRAIVVEQKLANAMGYEPFVLTRCKSEPMKTAVSKLQPESCVLENRKLERLSRAAISVGAAGLGF